MLGFATLGKFVLGQVGASTNVIVPSVFATGAAGVISGSMGPVSGVFGAGVAGIIMPSTLIINPRRPLANIVRRTRKLGRLSAGP